MPYKFVPKSFLNTFKQDLLDLTCGVRGFQGSITSGVQQVLLGLLQQSFTGVCGNQDRAAGAGDPAEHTSKAVSTRWVREIKR